MPEYASTLFTKKVGSKLNVWNGLAKETSGGLQKKDLMISKSGTVVSKKASQSAKNRMKSGKGLCEYCIKQYEESKRKPVKKESVKKVKKVKKESVKKEPVLKVKKPKGVTKNKVEELQKEIEKLREKAGKIAEKEGKMTKEVKNILETVTKKVREMIEMKKVLREKKNKL
jgi:hypothetical protein